MSTCEKNKDSDKILHLSVNKTVTSHLLDEIDSVKRDLSKQSPNNTVCLTGNRLVRVDVRIALVYLLIRHHIDNSRGSV